MPRWSASTARTRNLASARSGDRHWIGSVFDTLKGQLDLEYQGGRTVETSRPASAPDASHSLPGSGTTGIPTTKTPGIDGNGEVHRTWRGKRQPDRGFLQLLDTQLQVLGPDHPPPSPPDIN